MCRRYFNCSGNKITKISFAPEEYLTEYPKKYPKTLREIVFYGYHSFEKITNLPKNLSHLTLCYTLKNVDKLFYQNKLSIKYLKLDHIKSIGDINILNSFPKSITHLLLVLDTKIIGSDSLITRYSSLRIIDLEFGHRHNSPVGILPNTIEEIYIPEDILHLVEKKYFQHIYILGIRDRYIVYIDRKLIC